MGGFTWTLRFEDECPVWIDVQKLDAAWRRFEPDDYIEGPFAKHSGHCHCRYCQFGRWLEKGSPIEMAEVYVRPDVVSFTNGRHRFSWMRDHGIKTLPIAINPDDLGYVKLIYGRRKPRNSLIV